MLIYLACPIDAVGPDYPWINDAAQRFENDDHTVYSPARAWISTSPEEARRLKEVNRQVIELCDLVVARVTEHAFGTIREIEYARWLGKAVIAIDHTPGRKLADHFEAMDLNVCNELGEAIQILRDIDADTETPE